MGGVNPYIEKPEFERPKKRFKVTFLLEEANERKEFATFEVDPAQIPYGRTGLEGSILDIAEGAGLEIDHACGGVCACATCHVIVEKGLPSCSKATDDELDMIDTAMGVTTESRLSCQCVPDGTQDLVVLVPGWNKNYVKEGH
jgi:ferredoxin, 2Fe-2S